MVFGSKKKNNKDDQSSVPNKGTLKSYGTPAGVRVKDERTIGFNGGWKKSKETTYTYPPTSGRRLQDSSYDQPNQSQYGQSPQSKNADLPSTTRRHSSELEWQVSCLRREMDEIKAGPKAADTTPPQTYKTESGRSLSFFPFIAQIGLVTAFGAVGVIGYALGKNDSDHRSDLDTKRTLTLENNND